MILLICLKYSPNESSLFSTLHCYFKMLQTPDYINPKILNSQYLMSEVKKFL
jgi:hypothetical protein